MFCGFQQRRKAVDDADARDGDEQREDPHSFVDHGHRLFATTQHNKDTKANPHCRLFIFVPQIVRRNDDASKVDS